MMFSNDKRLNNLKINDCMLDDNSFNYELLDNFRMVVVEKLDTCVGVSFECDITYYITYGAGTRKLYNFIKLLIKSYDINNVVDLLKLFEKHVDTEYQQAHCLQLNINDGVWCTDDEVTSIIDWLTSTTIQSCIEYRDIYNDYHVASNINSL